jgi:hypothetical protein
MPVRTVSRGDLHPGDVIMLRGTSLVARLIIEFDGGTYSHCALYLGGGEVLEAIAEGVKRRLLDTTIADHKPELVDVFRYIDDGGIVLDGTLPYAPPVKMRADFYEREGDRYAFEDIILLALLTSIRHIPVIGPILRFILDDAAELIARLLAEGKHPLICSALVFRCFEEAGERYHIHVPDVELLAAANIGEMKISSAQMSFLRQYIGATGDLSRDVTRVHPGSGLGMAAVEPAPDFVTPRDLEYSPNLNKLGRLA